MPTVCTRNCRRCQHVMLGKTEWEHSSPGVAGVRQELNGPRSHRLFGGCPHTEETQVAMEGFCYPLLSGSLGAMWRASRNEPTSGLPILVQECTSNSIICQSTSSLTKHPTRRIRYYIRLLSFKFSSVLFLPFLTHPQSLIFFFQISAWMK